MEQSPEITLGKYSQPNPSAYTKKWNPYIGDGSNPSGILGKSSQPESKYSNIYEKKPLKLEDIEDE